jgi:hypothetical protein
MVVQGIAGTSCATWGGALRSNLLSQIISDSCAFRTLMAQFERMSAMAYRKLWRRELLESPHCTECGAKAWPCRISPADDGHETRSFECPKCGQVDRYDLSPADPLTLTLLSNVQQDCTDAP